MYFVELNSHTLGDVPEKYRCGKKQPLYGAQYTVARRAPTSSV